MNTAQRNIDFDPLTADALCDAWKGDATSTMAMVADALKAYRYSFSSETGLHKGMAEALRRAGIPFEQEVIAGPSERFDFLVDGGIVIEAKIKRSMPEALAQCLRYAQRNEVKAVVLAASRFWANVSVGDSVGGKPFVMVKLQRSL